MVRTIAPSPSTRRKAWGANPSAPAASASRFANGRRRLSIRPPPAAAPACRKRRRETACADGDRSEAPDARRSRIMSASLSARLRGLLDRFANADIGPAAADVAGHRVVDIGIGRMRVAGEERRSGHDLARLAVAALNDLPVEPGLLDLGACRRRADRLDRCDLGSADAVD